MMFKTAPSIVILRMMSILFYCYAECAVRLGVVAPKLGLYSFEGFASSKSSSAN